jgi:hypothetical protein
MMCTTVNEEGWDGEGVDSDVSSLMVYTLRYVSLVELDTASLGCENRELDTVCQFG